MLLYHGTALRYARNILSKGLRKGSYVTPDRDEALMYASSRSSLAVVVTSSKTVLYAAVLTFDIPKSKVRNYARYDGMGVASYFAVIKNIPSKYIVNCGAWKYRLGKGAYKKEKGGGVTRIETPVRCRR